MKDIHSDKSPKKLTLTEREIINRAKNKRIENNKGRVSTAIDVLISESTFNNIENPFKTDKYSFALINRLAREGSLEIPEFLPTEPVRSNKLYPKYVISSTESFGGTRAFRALIQNSYFDQPRSLKDTVGYASEAFGRSYVASDFGQVVKDLLKDGVISLCTGPDAGVKYYITINPVKDKWHL